MGHLWSHTFCGNIFKGHIKILKFWFSHTASFDSYYSVKCTVLWDLPLSADPNVHVFLHVLSNQPHAHLQVKVVSAFIPGNLLVIFTILLIKPRDFAALANFFIIAKWFSLNNLLTEFGKIILLELWIFYDYGTCLTERKNWILFYKIPLREIKKWHKIKLNAYDSQWFSDKWLPWLFCHPKLTMVL